MCESFRTLLRHVYYWRTVWPGALFDGCWSVHFHVNIPVFTLVSPQTIPHWFANSDEIRLGLRVTVIAWKKVMEYMVLAFWTRSEASLILTSTPSRVSDGQWMVYGWLDGYQAGLCTQVCVPVSPLLNVMIRTVLIILSVDCWSPEFFVDA